jgi:hypothetical protein
VHDRSVTFQGERDSWPGCPELKRKITETGIP